MAILIVIFALLILFDMLSYVAGADSRDSMNSPEWERSQNWKGYGGSGE